MINEHDSRAVANQLLQIAEKKGVSLTMMQLIKLTFFAHGWMLGVMNKNLISDPVEAWQYGPVYRRLYNSLPYQGAMIVSKPIKDEFGNVIRSTFDANEQDLLEWIVGKYGHLGAFALSEMTHEPGTPWSETIQKFGVHSQINNSLIREYFATQFENNRIPH